MKNIPFLFALLVAGCTGSGQVTYSGEVQTPNLVEVSPGVQVTADADTPVFYSDNYYWRNDNGVWLRSNRHDYGFARVDVVPTQIQSIDRPSLYVHYRAHARVVDGHEARKEIREERKDAKEQRKDAKEERKEERHERHEND